MGSYEARRRENIERNTALIKELGLDRLSQNPKSPIVRRTPNSKRRKLETSAPTRSSTRLASAPRPSYNESSPERTSRAKIEKTTRRNTRNDVLKTVKTPFASDTHEASRFDLQSITTKWTSWTPVAPSPSRDSSGTYHFESHPDFLPNKSPEEIIREGSFGGSYWRPLHSKYLRTTVEDDWRELPPEWTAGLDIESYLTSPVYDPEINKYGVACGQSIEEWEAAGWIAHEYDVRGWFQWYCRFWMGRRCDDDERQISRWRKCVGETGRWRRILLKKYVQMGIRSVFDEGDDDGEKGDVSPVVHQTCHHWAYEVRQDALDRFWREGR